MDAIGYALDRVIGIVLPGSEARRRLVRAALPSIRSATFAAAQSPRTIGAWNPVDASINEIIANSAAPVRARVRQLIRDFPYFARAVNVIADYVVGSGITYQAAIKGKDGKLDRAMVAQAEDGWARWCEEADASGRLHLYEMMYLAKRQELEAGEYILVRRHIADKSRFLPLALQMYEADWLSASGAKPNGSNKVHEGVEYDPATGKAVAYHFADPVSFGATTRIEANQVIHGFRTTRPGQLRGISEFTPGVLVARDLSDYMDAEMDGAKMAAKWMAIIETPDLLGRQLNATTSADGKKIEELQNAIIEYLRPGEKMNMLANPRPGTNFPPMVKLILTMLSISTGVPYELLSGNYEGMNYSVGKMVRTDFRHSLKPITSRHIRGFCEPVKRMFMEQAVLSGRLPFRDYFADPARYLRAEWQPPGMESIDPARESKAMIDQIKAGLRSPQEIAAARGRDLEDIYREIKEAQELAAEFAISIDLSEISTALANNPAAIEKQNDTSKTSKGATND